jgi:hypothetical protein
MLVPRSYRVRGVHDQLSAGSLQLSPIYGGVNASVRVDIDFDGLFELEPDDDAGGV